MSFGTHTHGPKYPNGVCAQSAMEHLHVRRHNSICSCWLDSDAYPICVWLPVDHFHAHTLWDLSDQCTVRAQLQESGMSSLHKKFRSMASHASIHMGTRKFTQSSQLRPCIRGWLNGILWPLKYSGFSFLTYNRYPHETDKPSQWRRGAV